MVVSGRGNRDDGCVKTQGRGICGLRALLMPPSPGRNIDELDLSLASKGGVLMDQQHPALQVATRTKLHARSAVAAFDACFQSRSRDFTHWTVPTPTGALRLTSSERGRWPRRISSSRQLAGDLDLGHGQILPVEVELIEDRRRCVVAVRPRPTATPATEGISRAGYVRAASDAVEALASALEETVDQWVASIDDHLT
jgi:hypothetical protein